MLRLAIVLLGLLLVAGCGSEEDGEGGLAGRSGLAKTELSVTVWPQGQGGPKRVRRVECPGAAVCGELSAQSFAPVPGNMACTAIYGGPDVAHVTGTLRGEPVDESFSLEDGCQIDRWDRNRELLGPPGNAP
jgi:hypothetical protein